MTRVTFACMLLLTLSAVAGAQQKQVLAADVFEKAIAQPGVQLLDVRSPGEYTTGYIQGAVNANWQDLPAFTGKVVKLDKTKAVYVYCLSGGRSGQAMDWLSEHGFSSVYNLEGGVRGWTSASKKLVIPSAK